jgi:hypothetical protein
MTGDAERIAATVIDAEGIEGSQDGEGGRGKEEKEDKRESIFQERTRRRRREPSRF